MKYQKLTGRNRSLTGFTQLWLAPGHILLVDSSRFVEQYKRFSLGDIEAIIVTEVPSNTALQGIMIVATLAWMALWFAVDSRFAKWSIEIIGLLGLMIPIVDMARGARCRCVLHTRVSKEALAPVNRVRTANRFLARIRPLIEEVQGAVPVQVNNVEQPAWEPSPPEIVKAPGYVPEILCGVFLLNALAIWLSVQFPKLADLQPVAVNITFAEIILIVVALVRRKGRDERVVVYAIIVLSILGLATDAITVSRNLTSWYLTILDKAKSQDKSITPMYIFIRGSLGPKVSAGWRAVAGTLGLAAAYWERRK